MPARNTLPLLLFLVAASRAGAQGADPPLAGRPEDFSGIAGVYRIQAEAKPAEVEVEQPTVLKVVLSGTGPEGWQPVQDKLRIFPPAAARDFFIEPVPELKRVEKGVWEFVYRLRPKSTEVAAIPSLKLVTYNPGRRKYQSAFADPIPITVKPAKPKDIHPKLTVAAAPEMFFQTRSDDAGFRLWTPTLRRVLEAVVLLGVPICCLYGLVLWRRRHPDVEQTRARRRSRAAQQALNTLQQGPERAEEVGAVLAAYLRERLDFPALEATPPEVTVFLARRGATKAMQRRWSAFFERCAAERFGAAPSGDNHLREEAIEIVQALEDQPCLSA